MLRSLAIVIQAVLDTILPRKERVVRTDSYTLEDIPISPVEHEIRGLHITTLLEYKTPVVQDLVKALKYDRADIAAKLLAGALAEYLREEIANTRAFSAKPVLLMPVPLHTSRLRERGFNQIEKVLQNLPDEFKNGELSRIDSTSLTRTRATPHQTQLSRSERLCNVEDAFALVHDVESAHIILVDDVTTTGATLTEAARPLAGKSVTLLALAHA